jgi:hypothetical protein
MVEGRQRDNWSHTSVLLALTANVNRDPKRRAFQPNDFNPFAKRRKTSPKESDVDMDTMKKIFVGKKKKK